MILFHNCTIRTTGSEIPQKEDKDWFLHYGTSTELKSRVSSHPVVFPSYPNVPPVVRLDYPSQFLSALGEYINEIFLGFDNLQFKTGY